MLWYVLKLLLLLPLLAGLIWASLWLTRKMQNRMQVEGRGKRAKLLETTFLAPGMKLAVIEFHGREILVATGKNGLTRLAEAPASPAHSQIEVDA